jgi:hypothetical protein
MIVNDVGAPLIGARLLGSAWQAGANQWRPYVDILSCSSANEWTSSKTVSCFSM